MTELKKYKLKLIDYLCNEYFIDYKKLSYIDKYTFKLIAEQNFTAKQNVSNTAYSIMAMLDEINEQKI